MRVLWVARQGNGKKVLRARIVPEGPQRTFPAVPSTDCPLLQPSRPSELLVATLAGLSAPNLIPALGHTACASNLTGHRRRIAHSLHAPAWPSATAHRQITAHVPPASRLSPQLAAPPRLAPPPTPLPYRHALTPYSAVSLLPPSSPPSPLPLPPPPSPPCCSSPRPWHSATQSWSAARAC